MSVSKKQISATVDDELKEILDAKDELNLSGIVNALLWQYVTQGENGTTADAAYAVRKERLEEEIADLRQEIQRKEQRMDRMDDRQQAAFTEKKEALEAAHGLVDATTQPDSPVVKAKASKCGMSPVAFMRALEQEYGYTFEFFEQ